MKEAAQGRKIRGIAVYTLSTLFFSALAVGLFYGLRPLLLPLILGAFLAYLFRPIANSFTGSPLSKYTRAAGFLLIVSSVFYWSSLAIKSSLPERKEKLELKVRLQYRLNERYISWMGLDKEPKGNFIYRNVGDELDELKKSAVEFISLNDIERKQFINDRLNANGKVNEEDRYYQYNVANLKARKIDIEKVKALAIENSSEGAAAPAAQVQEGSTLAAISHVFFIWLIMPLTFIFLLMDRGQVVHFFMGLIPNRYFELTYSIINNVDDALGRYIRGTMMECLLVGLSLFVGFYICGFDLQMAFLIGTVGGITNAIPFAGPMIACVLGIIYALVAENISPVLPFINENNLVLAVLTVVFVTRILDDAVFQPLVIGSAVSLHPVVVITAVFGGSLMFGFAGLIFAIPSIVVLKVVIETLFTGLKDYRII